MTEELNENLAGLVEAFEAGELGADGQKLLETFAWEVLAARLGAGSTPTSWNSLSKLFYSEQ